MDFFGYIAQFIVTLLLGAILAYSLKRWTMITAAIFGVFVALPLLAIVLFAGASGEFWNTIGSGLAMLGIGLLNLIKAGLIAAPVMTAGTLIGLAYGFNILR